MTAPGVMAVPATVAATTARVRGRVTDPGAQGVTATVHFVGPQNVQVNTDTAGAFSAELSPGTYDVQVASAGFLQQQQKLVVVAGQAQDLNVSVRARPRTPGARIVDNHIILSKPVTFESHEGPAGAPAALAAASHQALDEVVDLLVGNPQKRLRVEAHWDSSLADAEALALTGRQAAAISDYLVKQGVAEGRVEAVGMGAKKPVAPNSGIVRFRNRRVDLIVQ
jgi:outer membrane protein OmpA-like peptidoglycan-associated protein